MDPNAIAVCRVMIWGLEVRNSNVRRRELCRWRHGQFFESFHRYPLEPYFFVGTPVDFLFSTHTRSMLTLCSFLFLAHCSLYLTLQHKMMQFVEAQNFARGLTIVSWFWERFQGAKRLWSLWRSFFLRAERVIMYGKWKLGGRSAQLLVISQLVQGDLNWFTNIEPSSRWLPRGHHVVIWGVYFFVRKFNSDIRASVLVLLLDRVQLIQSLSQSKRSIKQ